MNDTDRYLGYLLGLATGGTLGTTLEFQRPGTFAPIADMVGGGPFGLESGHWTDDTSMALCSGESLLACGGFDPETNSRASPAGAGRLQEQHWTVLLMS